MLCLDNAQFSGRRVLTMEWVDGVKLADKQGLVQLDLRPRDVALQLLNAFGQMIFIHGFIHGGQLLSKRLLSIFITVSPVLSLGGRKFCQNRLTFHQVAE